MRTRSAKTLLRAAYSALMFVTFAVLVVASLPSAQAQTFKSLYSFTGSTDGANPFGAVIADKSGALYGTTEAGGAGFGTVYKLSKGKETVLYSFTGGADGSSPFASLVMDKSGNLYGTAIAGGSGYGTVFKVASKSKKETVLYTFTGGADGAAPFSGLLMDNKGNLYGTTEGGGSASQGTVYEVNIKTMKETVLHSFAGGTDGAIPLYGNLLVDAKGNLYGTTVGGGASGDGTVWEVSAKGTETVLYSFTGGDAGTGAFEQSLAMDPKGNLYGTTENGGTSSAGVVFKVKIKNGKEAVLYNFTGEPDAAYPSSGLTRDSTGNLYGTSQEGGTSNLGSVFEVKGTKDTILHSFAGSDGENPFTSPLLDTDGTLYGVTYQGGTYGYGTVFSLKP